MAQNSATLKRVHILKTILDPPRPTQFLFGLLIFHGLVWLLVSAWLNVHPDMADHWVWSRHLSWGYYEHPPMVAFTMRLVSWFSDQPIWNLKIGAVLFSMLNLGLAYLCCQAYTNRKTAWRFCILLECTHYFSVGSVFWHIDQPYLSCFLLTLYFVNLYVKKQKPHWLLLAGVAFGLGLLSKYTIVLLGASLGVWSIWQIPWVWKRLEFYLAALVAFLIFLPNLWWNFEHDWLTFNFQLSRGLTGGNLAQHWLDFVVGYWLLFSVIFSLHAWYCLVSRRLAIQTSLDKLLLVNAILPFVFFNLSALNSSIADPHWLNTSFLCLFMLYAHSFSKKTGLFGIMALLSYGINILVFIALLTHILFGTLNPLLKNHTLNKDSLAFIGWQQTATQIEKLLAENGINPPPFVISREYTNSSALALYLNFHPLPHSLEKPNRNLWSPQSAVQQQGALLVCRPHKCALVFEEEALPVFGDNFSLIGRIEAHEGIRLARTWDIYYLNPKPEPE